MLFHLDENRETLFFRILLSLAWTIPFVVALRTEAVTGAPLDLSALTVVFFL